MELVTVWDGNVHAPDRGSLDFVRGVDERDRVTFPKRMPPPPTFHGRYTFASERVQQAVQMIHDALATAEHRGVLFLELRDAVRHLVSEGYLYEIMAFLVKQGYIRKSRRERTTYRYFAIRATQEPV